MKSVNLFNTSTINDSIYFLNSVNHIS